jgi:hypothetical protein
VDGVAVDAGGDVYAVGETSSTDFPGADVPAEPDSAVFVTRVDGDGRGIVFTAILDGRHFETGRASELLRRLDQRSQAIEMAIPMEDFEVVDAGARRDQEVGRR